VLVEPATDELDDGVDEPVLVYEYVSVRSAFEEFSLQFQERLKFGQRNFGDFDVFHVKDEEHALDLSWHHHVYLDPLEPEGEVVVDVL